MPLTNPESRKVDKDYFREYYLNNKEKWKIYLKKQKTGEKYKQKIALQRIWQKENHQKILEINRKSYHNNKNKPSNVQHRKEYYLRSRNYQNKYWKQYYFLNKNKILLRCALYSIKHPDVLKKARKSYLQTERGKLMNRLWSHTYRARKAEVVFDLTKEQVLEIINRDVCCIYCGSSKCLTLDHIIPVKSQGDTTFKNIVLACKSCNSSKHDKDVFDWCEEKKIQVPKIIQANLLRVTV